MPTKKSERAPATKSKPSTKPAFRTAKKAQEAARAGDIDAAVTAVASFADGGDIGASVSLAEIHAFRGEWDEALKRAAPLIAKPDSVYAGNVWQDMVGIVWRVADETKRFADALAALRKMPKGSRKFVLFDSVEKYLASNGKGTTPVIGMTDEDPVEQRQLIEKKIARARAEKDSFAMFMFARDDARFDDVAVEHYPKARGPKMRWEYTIDAARAYVRKGRPDEAWKALEEKLEAWWPVEECQVAPVEIVYDQWLRTVCTPPRCAAILATKRGG